MYHFFVNPEQIVDKIVYIFGNDVNHIKNVLRMKIGDEIAVSNGIDGKEYHCGIEAIEESQIVCKLWFIKEDDVELPANVYLFQCLPKGDKMEMIVQKAVELGVYAIIPVSSRRCVVRLDEKKAEAKKNRWQGIAEAAAKQSRRRVIPEVMQVMSFSAAVKYAASMDIKLIPYEMSKGMERTREIIESLLGGENIAIFIGPEGGFEEGEIHLAMENGIEPISLGKRILKTETAGMTVMAWIIFCMEG